MKVTYTKELAAGLACLMASPRPEEGEERAAAHARIMAGLPDGEIVTADVVRAVESAGMKLEVIGWLELQAVAHNGGLTDA